MKSVPTRWITTITIATCAFVLFAGVAAASPTSVMGRTVGAGTMVSQCVSNGVDVRLTAEASMSGGHLGSGTATWTTCVDLGGNYVGDPPQTFDFSGNLGTLSGTVTDAQLEHVNGDCTTTNFAGQWNVTVTVTGLSGTGKLSDASGGQLTLQYRWERQDGGGCAVPFFPPIDMELAGTVTGSLS